MTDRIRTFAGPGRYLQGPAAIDRLGQVLASFGPRPVLVVDPPVEQLLGDRVAAALRDAGVDALTLVAEGEITYRAIDDLVARCNGVPASVVAGLGGGKVLDKAKALSTRLDVPVVTVPTIASNDSPTSRAIAMYDDGHALVAVDAMRANPAVVVVDTQLIASAPAHYLRAGIGDAVSKVFEAEACRDGHGLTPLGTRPLGSAMAIAQACYAALRADGVQAVQDCEAGEVTDALERVVEATILMSGLAFENGGLALAHSLTRGLMRVSGADALPHGYHVAWGALVQLAVEQRGTELSDLAGFLRQVGLPTGSADLHLTPPWEDAHAEIARYTMTSPHLANSRIEVTPAVLTAAMAVVDGVAAG